MYPRSHAVASAHNDAGDIDRHLLEDTQAYLELRSQCSDDPPPSLVDAWEHFYEFCTPLIRSIVATHRLTEEDVSDCVQEVWEVVIAKLRDFHYDPERGRFRIWLSTLARNKAVDLVRWRNRHAVITLEADSGRDLCSRDDDPVTAYERYRTRTLVRGALAALARKVSPRSYEILYLHWIEGRTVAEIAPLLNLTAEQVRYRHHRVKQKLRQLLELAEIESAGPAN